jgi:hypothetical protein
MPVGGPVASGRMARCASAAEARSSALEKCTGTTALFTNGCIVTTASKHPKHEVRGEVVEVVAAWSTSPVGSHGNSITHAWHVGGATQKNNRAHHKEEQNGNRRKKKREKLATRSLLLST